MASLPKLLTQTLIGGKNSKSSARQSLHQEVQIFMNVVHRARSKNHEAAIVHSELTALQQKLKQAEVSSSSVLIRNSFTKAIFCHLLGYDVTFVAIYAINLAQQGKGYDKRLGYLLCCLLLHPHHEMVMLMMATLLRDLKSSSMGDNCIALIVAGQLVGEENIASILPEVIKKLKHSHELVREKAIYCLQAFYYSAPSLVQSSLSQLNLFLESRDPGILSAVVNIFLVLVRENPHKYVSLGGSFLHILDQINSGGFGSTYYYHMVPLPWLQINLLKILGHLGSVEARLQSAIASFLQTLIEKTKVTEPVSLAILIESVLTAAKIHADEPLLNLCSRCIGKLLSSDASNSMRYQGLGLLISLSRLKSSFAAQHQKAVVECLADEDPAIQYRTTYLLHAMANRANIKPICSKLFDQIQRTKDKTFVDDIIKLISDLAERLAPGIDWYVQTYLSILHINVGHDVQLQLTEQVLLKIENIFQTEDSVTVEEKNSLMRVLLEVINQQSPSHPTLMLSIEIMALIAPKLGTIMPFREFLDSAEKLLLWQNNSFSSQSLIPRPSQSRDENMDIHHILNLMEIKCSCLRAIIKLVLAGSLEIPAVREWLQKQNYRLLIRDPRVLYLVSLLEDLIQHPENVTQMSQIVFDSSHLDLSLSFLDTFIVQELAQGKETLRPKYLKTEQNTDSSVGNITEVITSVETNNSSSVVSKSSSNVKTKWVDEEETSNTTDSEKKPEESIANEIFLGLDDTGVSEHYSFNNTYTKSRNKWADEENDSLSGLSLNPFGISKKNSQFSRWHEEDDTDNASCISDADASQSSFISNQSEKVESPLNYPGQINLPYLSEPYSLEAELSSSSYNTTAQQEASIYSEYLADMTSPNAGSFSLSTMETLTDSEPEDAT